ncbi:MAG: hypothetical protein NUV56_00440 [Candidatus Uhrbacteria bacterium]|nr:hypothetical protein [Candidatus Uhrbacteria bacterium]
MFEPFQLAIASMATAAMMATPGNAHRQSQPKPPHILPPSITHVLPAFDEVKANILKQINRTIDRLEKHTERVENNDKLTAEQRAKRLENISKHEDRAIEIKAKVEAADSLDDLNDIHKASDRRTTGHGKPFERNINQR